MVSVRHALRITRTAVVAVAGNVTVQVIVSHATMVRQSVALAVFLIIVARMTSAGLRIGCVISL